MNFLGLNSPEIFLITVIILYFLGTKRIEKGLISFNNLLKYLLSKEENSTTKKSNLKAEEPKKSELKKDIIEAKIKAEEPKKSELKKDIIDLEIKPKNPKKVIKKKT